MARVVVTCHRLDEVRLAPSGAVATAFLLLATLALVACGEDDVPAAENPSDIDPSADSSPSVESTDGTEGTEVAEPEAIPTAYPEVGLRFVDFPELTTKEANTCFRGKTVATFTEAPAPTPAGASPSPGPCLERAEAPG